MTGIPAAEETEAAQAGLQVNAAGEAKTQASSSTGDIVDGALNVAGNAAAEAAAVAVETVVESIGAIATATGEAVVTVIGGIFEGLSS